MSHVDIVTNAVIRTMSFLFLKKVSSWGLLCFFRGISRQITRGVHDLINKNRKSVFLGRKSKFIRL